MVIKVAVNYSDCIRGEFCFTSLTFRQKFRTCFGHTEHASVIYEPQPEMNLLTSLIGYAPPYCAGTRIEINRCMTC